MSRPEKLSITFEKGLNEFLEPSRLEPGFSVLQKNWISEPDGSLRVRVGWIEVKATDAPATRKVRGISHNPKHFHTFPGTDPEPAFIVANADTIATNPGYRFYHVPTTMLDDPLETWVEFDALSGAGWNNSHFVPMAMGGGHLLYCTRDFAEVRAWKGDVALSGTNPFYIPDSRAGKTIAFYKNRIFTAGGPATTDPNDPPEIDNGYSTQPWRLWFSGLLGADLATDVIYDTTSLTNPAGFVEIGKDDGQDIEYITPFDQGILVGKSESLYYLVGSSPASFQLIGPLDAGECAPGRTIAVTPYGAVICGKTDAYLFKGNIPEPIDTPVASTYGLQEDAYMTVAYIDGSVYICDAGRDETCVYDIANDTWRLETYGFLPGAVYSFQEETVIGPWNSATRPLMLHRTIPTGDRTIDENLGMLLHVITPEMWLGGASRPVTIRHVYARIRQRGGDETNASLTVNNYQDGAIVTTQDIDPLDTPGVFRVRLDVKGTAYSVQFEFIQVNTDTDEAVFDIEEIEIHLESEEYR